MEMNDKLAFTHICGTNGLSVVPIIGTTFKGIFEQKAPTAMFDCDLSVREHKSCGGKFVLNFERVAELTWRDDTGNLLDCSTFKTCLTTTSRSHGLIVQPRLKNHPSVAFLTETSLVVFRTVTCFDEVGEPHLTHPIGRESTDPSDENPGQRH